MMHPEETQPEETQPEETQLLRSAMADSPEFRPLLDKFVSKLPGYADELRSLAADRTALREATHKLKGALGVYRYPLLAAHAEQLELAIDDGDSQRVAERLETLVGLLMRAAAAN